MALIVITSRMSRRRREMYDGHARLSVDLCLSVPGRIATLLHVPECSSEEW